MDKVSQPVAGSDDVVAAVGVDDEILGGADVEEERRRGDAIEPHAAAVGRDREGLGAVAAIDLGGIGAVAALHEVVVIARVPDHAIVAGFAEHLVVAIAAVQDVVARAAEQQVVSAFAQEGIVACAAEQLIRSRAAGEHVIARAAEQLGGGQRAVGFVERDPVVAALAEHLHQGGVGDRRLAAVDGDGTAIDENLPSRVAADRDGVIGVVVEH